MRSSSLAALALASLALQGNIQAGQTPNISRPSTFFFTDIAE